MLLWFKLVYSNIRKAQRFVSKQGHRQPRFHSKARQISYNCKMVYWQGWNLCFISFCMHFTPNSSTWFAWCASIGKQESWSYGKRHRAIFHASRSFNLIIFKRHWTEKRTVKEKSHSRYIFHLHPPSFPLQCCWGGGGWGKFVQDSLQGKVSQHFWRLL